MAESNGVAAKSWRNNGYQWRIGVSMAKYQRIGEIICVTAHGRRSQWRSWQWQLISISVAGGVMAWRKASANENVNENSSVSKWRHQRSSGWRQSAAGENMAEI